MLPRELLRSEPERVAAAVKARGVDPALVDQWTTSDRRRREALTELEELRHRRRLAGQEIGRLKAQGEAKKDDTEHLILEMTGLKVRIDHLEEAVEKAEGELTEAELQVPNIAHESVPVGADESANRVERVVFYFNGRRVAARNRAPYRARIDLGRGDRLGRVEAVAFDAEDRELDRHELLVNQPPHAFWVRITEPGEGLLAGPVGVTAELKLPRGGRLLEMRFFVKDRLAGTATEAPFRREVLVPVGDPESYLRVEAQLTDGRIAEDVLFLSRPGLSARIGVELVQLYVVATDRSGQPLPDLPAAAFAVFEDDRPHALSSFRTALDLLGAEGLVDLVGLMGYYCLVSFTLNVFRIEPPGGPPSFA